MDLVDCLKAITEQTVWVILMTGGGHFAGAVFRGWVAAFEMFPIFSTSNLTYIFYVQAVLQT